MNTMTTSIFDCPHCGAHLSVVDTERVDLRSVSTGHTTYREQPARITPARVGDGMTRTPTRTTRGGMRHYHQGGGAALADTWRAVTFETPARSATKEADVVVPLFQALITGAFVGVGVVIAGVGAVMAGVDVPWWSPLPAGLVAALATAGGRWGGLLDDSRALLRKVESYTGRDLDGDGEVGDPETIRVEYAETDDGGGVKAMGYAYIQHKADLRLIAAALAAGTIKRLSRREIAEIPGITSGHAADILAALEKERFVSYPNGKTGAAELTSKGRALFRGLAAG